jgi:protein BCP1
MKRKQEQVPETFESDSESHASTGSGEYSDVEVDFVFRSFSEVDFHGIKNFLINLFGPPPKETKDYYPNLSEITEYIIAQNNLGTSLKVESDEDEDPVGFMSICDLKGKVFEPVMKYIEKYSSDDALFKKFEKLSDKSVLFHERMINLPPHVSLPMYRMMKDEIKETGYKCEYFAVIHKIYDTVPKTEQFSFNIEDDLFSDLAEFSWTLNAPLNRNAEANRVFQEEGVVHQRRVSVYKMEKLDKIVNIIASNVE